MKTMIVLIILSFTVCSCYSYHSMNNTHLENGKIYKITNEKNIISKIKVIEVRQDSTVVLDNRNQISIANTKIKNAEERKFSLGKTSSLI